MNKLSEDLINQIMLYVSHHCADIIHNSITTIDGTHKMIKPNKKHIPNIKFHKANLFVVRDDAA